MQHEYPQRENYRNLLLPICSKHFVKLMHLYRVGRENDYNFCNIDSTAVVIIFSAHPVSEIYKGVFRIRVENDVIAYTNWLCVPTNV